MTDCSIVVCTHDGAERIPAVLAALRAQQAGDLRWEVVVVDNASTDGTADATRAAWRGDVPAPLEVVHEPELGLSNARHAGIRAANGAVISFVDDDNLVADDWVAGVVDAFRRHPEAGAVGGHASAELGEPAPVWFPAAAPYLAVGAQGDPGDITGTRGHLYGAGLSLRREAVEQVLAHGGLRLGGRTGSTGSGEDTELCYRLVSAGWRLRYHPELRLRHVIPPHRVDRDYVRRVVAGSGRVEVLLEPLRLRGRRGLRFALQRRWWLQAFRELVRLIRLRISRPADDHGFATELATVAARARLRTLLELRDRFDRAVLDVRDAPPGAAIVPDQERGDEQDQAERPDR